MIVHFRLENGEWRPHAEVQVDFVVGQVTRIRDYVHIERLLRHSDVIEIKWPSR